MTIEDGMQLQGQCEGDEDMVKALTGDGGILGEGSKLGDFGSEEAAGFFEQEPTPTKKQQKKGDKGQDGKEPVVVVAKTQVEKAKEM
eukprot:13148760-Alexandrium_andersonii.AAC.1